MGLFGALSADEREVEDRLRTLALCLCAMGVVGYALFWLRAVLVPLVLAIALSYLLQPAIDVLTKRPIKCCWGICVLCRERPQLHSVRPCIRPFVEALIEFRLPYYVSVCIVLALSMAMLGLIGFIVADSVHVFTRHADVYGTRVQTLIIEAIDFYNRMQDRLFGPSTPGNLTEVAVTNDTAAVAVSAEEEEPTLEQRLLDISRRIDRTQVTSIVMSGLSSLLETVSNLFLVMLFTLYLLLGVSPYFACPLELRGPPTRSPLAQSDEPDVVAQSDAQIHSYIRGKVLVCVLVGVLTALSLWACSVELWLVFGLLAFWLNFVPNVGTVVAVALPLPLVILDPAFSTAGVLLVLLLPLGAHAFAGNVVEPLLFGHILKLHPVAVLLSLLFWYALWGITGMVLAVPMTAVARIRLAHVKHPLPRYLAALLGSAPGEQTLTLSDAPEGEAYGGDAELGEAEADSQLARNALGRKAAANMQAGSRKKAALEELEPALDDTPHGRE